jgi:glycosyltransferase involved in cell wall biosynthesis
VTLPSNEGRWLLIAAGSRSAAERFAAREGMDVGLLLERADLVAAPTTVRRRIAAAAADRAALHSVDWTRERTPQISELALALAPVRERWLIDEASGSRTSVRRAAGAATLARLPFEALTGAGRGLRDSARFGLRGRRGPVVPGRRGDGATVLAIFPGHPRDGVGGSVTHMAGILGGFRSAGLRIAIASAAPLPAQLEAVADDVEVAPPQSRGVRLLRDLEEIADNGGLAGAAERLAARTPPAFVYQRHRAFLAVGAAVARSTSAPTVLEWNGSEHWARRNWNQPTPRDRYLDPLVAHMERVSVRSANIVAAVSDRAAEMAREAGAPPERVVVSPNAVDAARIIELASAEDSARADRARTIGWVGSFGPWHGAEYAVRALARLPDDVRLRMIGDGVERAAVRELAGNLGLDGRIDWVGSLAHEEAVRALSGCDVLIAPTVPAGERPFIGSPTKLFEYMAIGRPIVATRLEQIAQVMDDGETGLLVEPEDVSELVEAIERLLADPGLGERLGAAAREEAVNLHTWDLRARGLLAALEERG